MKKRQWLLALWALSLTFYWTNLAHAEAFIDPRLQVWNENPGNSLMPKSKEVIVYLRKGEFTNRSFMTRGGALAAEKAELTQFVKKEAIRLAPAQGVIKGATSAEVLWSSQAFITQIDRVGLARLLNDSSVEGVIENITIPFEQPQISAERNKTDESTMTYGLQTTNVPSAWSKGFTGKGVRIGIIDTGIDPEHPDLKGKVVLTKDFTPDADMVDYHGHGTHVAGTIAGGRASGRAIGVAPEAELVIAKVFDSKGRADTASLLRAMEWMIDPDGDPLTNDAPRVVSNSWGANTQFFYGFRNVVEQWVRFNIFPNFAAGNSGWFFTVGAPASYPISFAVAAVDEDNNVTSFSSRGPVIVWKGWWPTFITKPDVAAPGFNVYSSLPGGKYEYYSGTSMATPHVSGILALALQANPMLGIDDLKGILESTALARQNNGKNYRYGSGVVQADKVVDTARSWQTQSNASYFLDKARSRLEWDTP